MEVPTTMDTPRQSSTASSAADPDTLVQLLDPQGRRLDHATYTPWVAGLSEQTLRQMYRDMALTRAFDEQAVALQRQGELGLWPPSLGQEAAQVGSAHATVARDFVFPAYREHGVALSRGLDVRQLLRVFRGVEHGGWDPAEANFHLYTFVIGAHVLHATGYAMGIQRDGDVGSGDVERDRAALAYFGDGATSQGDVHEAMVFAGVNHAPLVFICQNNQWAISVPASGQSKVPLSRRGQGVGIPSVRVDGNDVLASYAVAAEALQRARNGGGPTFIEAYTYRLGAHTTTDDPTRYRTSAEEEYWRERDPMTRMRTYLEQQGTGADFFADVDAAAEELTGAAREYCRGLAKPEPGSIFDHVYGTEHTQLGAERADFTAYLDSFDPQEASR